MIYRHTESSIDAFSGHFITIGHIDPEP